MIGSFYPILLLIACLILAIQIRKVPSGFNEAKYIGFAVYTTLIIWLVRVSQGFKLFEDIKLISKKFISYLANETRHIFVIELK